MKTSVLERYLTCQFKAFGTLSFGFVEKHDPEILPVLQSIGDRIMGPTVDLEAKRKANLDGPS